jgi:S1-C subfamily serine protease
LIEIATAKVVVTGQTFARVSYDIPGQAQRFARLRGLRDAETRAAKVIAENVRSRLASYFIAGTWDAFFIAPPAHRRTSRAVNVVDQLAILPQGLRFWYAALHPRASSLGRQIRFPWLQRRLRPAPANTFLHGSRGKKIAFGLIEGWPKTHTGIEGADNVGTLP